MSVKNVILFLVLIVRVRSDCDGYFECLSGFVKDYLSGNKTIGDNTDYIDFGDLRNTSVGLLDLSHVGRSVSQALTDVTTLIKDEIKGMFYIDAETDVHKEIENKTEIHVKALSLNRAYENITEKVNKIESVVPLPEVIVNNLTKFNDELNALKLEIENNLQAELVNFISQILENDTVDWVEVTEHSFENEFTTTLKPYPDFEESFETTIETINVTSGNISVTNEPNINISTTEFEIAEDNETTRAPIEKDLISEKDSYTKRIPEHTSLEAVTTNKHITTAPISSTATLTTVAPVLSSSVASTTVTIPTTASNTREETDSTTTIASQTTKLQTTIPSTKITTEKQQTHTKSPIDYKLLENVKVNEISNDDLSYYEIKDDNSTDYPIIDYVDLYKDTTNEDLDYVPTPKPTNEIKSDLDNLIQNGDEYENNGYYTNDTSNPASVFPWLAAIFIKNGTNNQFDYYCDGTIISDRAVLTAARCLQRGNETVNADDVIVFLGKRSLQNTAEEEVILRVNQITLHPNFSLQNMQNDLAVVQLEEAAVLSELIQPACLVEEEDEESDDAVATAWGESLSLIKFTEKNHTCIGEPVENTFCATYGASVALCPSYGGVYAALQSGRWCAAGLRTGDVTKRGLCFDKTVAFTDLRAYTQWLKEFV